MPYVSSVLGKKTSFSRNKRGLKQKGFRGKGESAPPFKTQGRFLGHLSGRKFGHLKASSTGEGDLRKNSKNAAGNQILAEPVANIVHFFRSWATSRRSREAC